MLVGASPSAALAPAARASSTLACPHCEAPRAASAVVCDYCGTTLGEPKRRAGATQRAMALDEEGARRALEASAAIARAAASPSAAIAPTKRRATPLERLLVVLTLGIGWLWVRRRLA